MIKGNLKAQGGHSGWGKNKLTIQKRHSQQSEDCLMMVRDVKEDKGVKGEQIQKNKHG